MPVPSGQEAGSDRWPFRHRELAHPHRPFFALRLVLSALCSLPSDVCLLLSVAFVTETGRHYTAVRACDEVRI